MTSIAVSIQSDFNGVVDNIGTSVTVFERFTSAGVGSYNIYGDLVLSGANLYISGVSASAFFSPRNVEDLSIQEFGERIDGDIIGYFKSGPTIDIGYRVSGVNVGDFKVNAINRHVVSGLLCFSAVMLDKLNK